MGKFIVKGINAKDKSFGFTVCAESKDRAKECVIGIADGNHITIKNIHDVIEITDDEQKGIVGRIVDKNGLIKDIKKRFGNSYTIPQIEKIIEEDGCNFFNKYGTVYEYLNFGKWKIVREDELNL